MTRTKALVLLVVVVLGGAVYADVQVSVLSGRTSSLAAQALGEARDIQAQRVFLIHQSCMEQNQRHTHTVQVLDRLLARAERAAPLSQRAQIRANRAPTLLIINQLVPYQNCRLVVAHAIARK